MKQVWERTMGGDAWRSRAMSLAAVCAVVGFPGHAMSRTITARAARAVPVTGEYVLTQAAGGSLPYAFELDMGRPVHGQVLGATLVLGANGDYTSDVKVRMDLGDALPIPGLSTGNSDRIFHSAGNYTASGESVILSPSDWLTRRLATRVLARVDGRTMMLTAVDRPPDGQRYELAAAFEKIK